MFQTVFLYVFLGGRKSLLMNDAIRFYSRFFRMLNYLFIEGSSGQSRIDWRNKEVDWSWIWVGRCNKGYESPVSVHSWSVAPKTMLSLNLNAVHRISTHLRCWSKALQKNLKMLYFVYKFRVNFTQEVASRSRVANVVIAGQ